MKNVQAPEHSRLPKRVLALDWIDGATAGLVEYDGCDNVFHFRLVSSQVSEPWVFALRSSPVGHLSDLDEALAPLGAPRIPVWVPIWRFESERERDHAETLISAAMAPSAIVAIVVARRIQDTPIAARGVATQEERQTVERMEREMADVSAWMHFCDATTGNK